MTQLKNGQRDLNRYFNNKDIQMRNKHMEMCTVLLVVRETHNKTIVRHCYKSIKMSKVKTTTTIMKKLKTHQNYCQRYEASGTLIRYQWSGKLHNHLKRVRQFLVHLYMHLPYDLPFHS